MKTWIVMGVLAAGMTSGLACKKEVPVAVATPTNVVRKEYNASRDETTVLSSDVIQQLDGREIRASAYHTYKGTVSADTPKDIYLMVTSKPSGVGVDGDMVPFSVVLANGDDLTRDRSAMVDVAKGTRAYTIDLDAARFEKLRVATKAVVTVNDIKLTLSQQDLNKLGEIVTSPKIR